MRVVDMHCDTIAALYQDHRAGGLFQCWKTI